MVLIGDSHMEMLGPLTARRLRDECRVSHFAFRGAASRVIARDLDVAALRRLRPSVVVLVAGSNDYGVRRTSRYRGRVEALLDAIRTVRPERVIWYGPPSVDAERSERNARVATNHAEVARMQRELAADMDWVEWVDAAPITEGHNGTRDGIHLTRRGYGAWVDHIVRAVRSQ